MRELMDPRVAAGKFYAALVEVDGWQNMSVTEAGQAVKNSAYPNAYADDVPLAEQLLADPDLTNASAAAWAASRRYTCLPALGADGPVAFPLPRTAKVVDLRNWGDSGGRWARGHTGTDFSAPCGTPALAATGLTCRYLRLLRLRRKLRQLRTRSRTSSLRTVGVPAFETRWTAKRPYGASSMRLALKYSARCPADGRGRRASAARRSSAGGAGALIC